MVEIFCLEKFESAGVKFEGAHDIPQHSSFFEFQPKNTQIRQFWSYIWKSVFLKKYYILTTILSQSYFSFPVLNRKTFFYFFKKKIHISCVYYLLSQRFFHLMTAKLPKKRNNLLEEMNPEWDCIVSRNTCFQQIFIATEKKSKEIFLL